jgi:hypothetical protein
MYIRVTLLPLRRLRPNLAYDLHRLAPSHYGLVERRADYRDDAEACDYFRRRLVRRGPRKAYVALHFASGGYLDFHRLAPSPAPAGLTPAPAAAPGGVP